jgi:hypothetical protein
MTPANAESAPNRPKAASRKAPTRRPRSSPEPLISSPSAHWRSWSRPGRDATSLHVGRDRHGGPPTSATG